MVFEFRLIFNFETSVDIKPEKRCRDFASVMSPVPGGIGPLTIAHLCRNTLNAYLLKNSEPIMPLLEKVWPMSQSVKMNKVFQKERGKRSRPRMSDGSYPEVDGSLGQLSFQLLPRYVKRERIQPYQTRTRLDFAQIEVVLKVKKKILHRLESN